MGTHPLPLKQTVNIGSQGHDLRLVTIDHALVAHPLAAKIK